ncbi:hypothetical protein OAJ94_03095 [Deltaproteobacteria bacterium]|nr:hypothetical protein [Deltaproteobacteria bacterium]
MQSPPDAYGGPMSGPGGPPPAAAGPGGPPPSAAMMDSSDHSIKGDLSISELRTKVKKARWNVFMYLGIAAIMFAFALIPLPVPAPWDDETTLKDSETGGEIQRELPYLFGLPIDGHDATDIRFIVEITPKDGGNLSVHVIEAHCNTEEIDNELNEFASMLIRDDINWSDNHAFIEDSTPGKTIEVEFKLDPGAYCLVIEYTDYGHSTGSLEASASVYGLREIGGGLGGLSVFWALFGFIGAQKKGKILKERTEPRRGSTSVEEQVMDATNQGMVAAGPSAPPPGAGPSGGPPTGVGPMAGPPTAAPPSPTQDAFAALGVVESAPVAPPAAATPAATLNYIESGDGYYYILKEDNTFDTQPYIKQADGSYLPFQ